MLGAIMAIPCGQKRVSSGVAGAAVVVLGIDSYLAKQSGAPPWVHWALAGMVVDGLCRGPDVANDSVEALRSAGLGMLGALVAARML